jgi:hypothetical protein
MDAYELKQALQGAAELGAATMARELGVLRDEISQREAYRKFGEAKVKYWKAKGLIKRLKEGERNAKVTYSFIELKALQQAEKIEMLSKP